MTRNSLLGICPWRNENMFTERLILKYSVDNLFRISNFDNSQNVYQVVNR